MIIYILVLTITMINENLSLDIDIAKWLMVFIDGQYDIYWYIYHVYIHHTDSYKLQIYRGLCMGKAYRCVHYTKPQSMSTLV